MSLTPEQLKQIRKRVRKIAQRNMPNVRRGSSRKQYGDTMSIRAHLYAACRAADDDFIGRVTFRTLAKLAKAEQERKSKRNAK